MEEQLPQPVANGDSLPYWNAARERKLLIRKCKACNEFHWASWGEKRSVIALKNNVSFVYENGKITPPASGQKLWKAIEPPHAGSGLAEEDAIGFAEDVPLPKP